MDCREFFLALKGNNLTFFQELDNLSKELNLEKLYLIYINEQEAAWGLRGIDVNYENVARKLSQFMKDRADLNYDTENTRLIIFGNESAEVNYVLKKELVPYIESHEGYLEIISISENSGEVVVSLRGTCGTCPSALVTMKMGIQRTLISLLPWVKEVKSIDKPEDPDFGIKELLDETQHDLGGEGGD